MLLDTHLDGLSGLTEAIEIRQQNPDQRIMMSASPRDHLPDELLKSTKILENDIFTRPFRLVELICSIELVH